LKHLFRAFLFLFTLLAIIQPALADRLPFLVPVKTIYPGQIISDTGLKEKLFYIKREAASLYVDKLEQVMGKITRRTLIAGKPIALSAITAQLLIERGQQVRMVFNADTLSISSIGVALQPGSIGDVIRLRNIDSGVVVSGRVQEDGHVEIGLS